MILGILAYTFSLAFMSDKSFTDSLAALSVLDSGVYGLLELLESSLSSSSDSSDSEVFSLFDDCSPDSDELPESLLSSSLSLSSLSGESLCSGLSCIYCCKSAARLITCSSV